MSTSHVRSVAVWSPKGGVGKSVLAVALALKLAERQLTVVIDANTDNPDVANLLQVPWTPNVTSWAEPATPEQVESQLVRHSTRLWVLPGPKGYADAATVTGTLMESALAGCLGAGFTVVVDLGQAWHNATLVALDTVDRVFIPVTLDLLSVRPLRRLTDEWNLLGFDESKFRVVINRHTTTREITADDIREHSPFLVEAAVIPSARELAAAVNRGQVGAALAGDSAVGKAVATLIEPLLVPDGEPHAEKPRSLASILGGWRKGEA